jgi:DNA mismatch repair protein MutS2
MENLLETLEGKEQALSRALADAASARDEATRMKAALDLRQRALDERERAAETLARDEARRRLLEARSEVEEAIRELRATDEAQREEAARAARRRIEVAAEAQRSGSPYAPPASSSNRTRGKGGRGAAPSPRGAHPLGASAIVEGDRVRIRGSGARGVVRLRREDRLVVEVGGLRLQLREGEVERIEGGQAQGEGGATSRATASGGRAPRPRDAEGGGGTITIPEHLPRFEVQLLGLRVDEVELALGRAIDDAVIGSLPELRIVHGKGTGAVRARVQELLRSDPRVESFRGGVHGEGGGGVTVAVLR